jgi:hypothetical protein
MVQDALHRAWFRPRPYLNCEPMFDSKRKLTARLADAVDLAIDFATLGEYGLEPVATAPPCAPRRHGSGSGARFAADRPRQLARV